MRAKNLIMAAVAGVAMAGGLAGATAGVARATLAGATAGVARANETVYSCGVADAGGANRVFAPHQVFGINPADGCGKGGPASQPRGLQLNAPGNLVAHGQSAHWQATAPPGLQIVLVNVPAGALTAPGNSSQYAGGFYWAGGGRSVRGLDQTAFGASGFSSSYLGFSLTCAYASPCRGGNRIAGQIEVRDIALQAQETIGPSLTAGAGLWQAGGYVRGDWPLSFTGDSPSGVCVLAATLDGKVVGSQGFPANPTVWHQCAATGLATVVHTTLFGDGPHSLTLGGKDAAQLVTPGGGGYTRGVNIDNQAPTVAVSGPGDAPSTAGGTQYVTATGTAGPSGLSGISCTIDGHPSSYAGASARVPVSGVGVHTITCQAANNSRDASGAVAVSAPASTTLSIRQSTVSGIAFNRFVGLRCRLVRVRVKVPGRVVTRRRHHKLVPVHRRGHTKTVRVKRCHARIEYRRVPYFTTITRHGKPVRVKHYKRVKVVVAPHEASSSTRRVGYGHSTTVSGALLDSNGAPLAGQTIQVISAPDNGQGQFAQAAVAHTGSNGAWSATLPAGPSRLVQTLYGGATLTEPSASGVVRLIVPARVRLLSITPRRVPWGGTVRITGQLEGGYLPATGALVRLRIGIGPARTTYGVQTHVTGSGRFETNYTFNAGDPSHHQPFFFQIASLPVGDYPYAPANSREVTVIVGGHPHGGGGPPPRPKHKARKKHPAQHKKHKAAHPKHPAQHKKHKAAHPKHPAHRHP